MSILNANTLSAIEGWPKRALFLGISLMVLGSVYLFQRFSYFDFFCSFLNLSCSSNHPYTIFIVNKSARFLINDTMCVLMIYAIFYDRKYTRVALYLELFGLLIFLPIYFYLKLTIEGDSEISSPLLSQLHRLIINPTLMLLLMLAFVYQKRSKQSRRK